MEPEHVRILKEQYKCPHFRILVAGRANAGKTTILEKVCGVTQGTKPIIYDQNGVVLDFEPKTLPKRNLFTKVKHLLGTKPVPSANVPTTHIPLTPSIEVSTWCLVQHGSSTPWYTHFQRGIHDIEHQITYSGSNFIFHDSQGFEAGASGEMEIVWNFIEKRSVAFEMRDKLHAIWYYLCNNHIHGHLMQDFTGIAFLWRAHVLFYLQSLSSLQREQGMVWHFNFCFCTKFHPIQPVY